MPRKKPKRAREPRIPADIVSAFLTVIEDRITLSQLTQLCGAEWLELVSFFQLAEVKTTDEQRIAMFEEIQQALPSTLRKKLADLSDAEGYIHAIEQDAAFRLGLEIGRRLGGGR